MLVLSRRPGQRIVFPELQIAIEVLPAKGSNVRLGVEAPVNVSVLREELLGTEAAPRSRESERRSRHDACGRLNTLAMALHLVRKQLKAGLTADAENTLSQAQEILEKLAPAGAPSAAPPPGNPIDALLVEDNVHEEALLSSYLRMSDFRVATVHDGYEALEFLASHERPDFLLLDMRMPRCDGPTTVTAIRQIPAYRDLKIFAVTGSSPSEFDLSTGESGVNAWFQKPLNPKRLVDAMSAAVSPN
jgi:carbon storage regulator CsrA